MPLIDLHHVAIKSKDLAATEKFYTKVLPRVADAG